MRHLWYCPKCFEAVVTRTEENPGCECGCKDGGFIDAGGFPDDWSDEQCVEFVTNKIGEAIDRTIVEGDTFSDLQPVGMPRTEAQQAGMFLNSDGEEITATQGTEGFPQVTGNDLHSNLQLSVSAAQQIKNVCRMWDKLSGVAPVVIVSPALLERLIREDEFPLFQRDDYGNYILWECDVRVLDNHDETKGEYFWLANEDPINII